MKRITLIALNTLVATTTVQAAGITTIAGNPIKRQDNYTINAAVPRWVDINCTFINTGNQPADLEVWTNPDATIPTTSIHLKKSSKVSPHKIRKYFHLPLKKQWWCSINTPKEYPTRWAYCVYFSISDATIVRKKPFKTWDKTIHSKDTSYYCQLKHANERIRFFVFQ